MAIIAKFIRELVGLSTSANDAEIEIQTVDSPNATNKQTKGDFLKEIQADVDGKSPTTHTHTHESTTGQTADDHHPQLHDLASHTDIEAATPSQGQRLAWESSTGKWVPRTSNSGLSILVFHYKMTLPPDATPAAGRISRNNADPALATLLYINNIDDDGSDESQFWGEIKEHDWFNIYKESNVGDHESYDVTGAATDMGTYWEVPVTLYIAEGTALANNNKVGVVWRISPNYPHDVLVDRDAIACHPIGAITGLHTALGYRNILINGAFRVNQRNFDGNWLALATDDFGYDGWFKFITGYIAQKAETINMVLDAEYTLSWEGDGNCSVEGSDGFAIGGGPSPFTAVMHNGTFQPYVEIVLPDTSANIQLERGSVATPFEVRNIQQEIAMCQRFYWEPDATEAFYGTALNHSNELKRAVIIKYPQTMRTTPIVTGAVVTGVEVSKVMGKTNVYFNIDATASGSIVYVNNLKVDAEL